jgi:hypothetical protein
MPKQFAQIGSVPASPFLLLVTLVLAGLAVLLCGLCLRVATADWRAAKLPMLTTQSERDAYARHDKARAAARYFIDGAMPQRP